VSEGILRGGREGVVTSTSALALAPAFAVCGPWLRDAEDLGVGVHLAAVGEDPPLLPAREIPTLVDRRGRLARSWRAFLGRASAGRVDPDDLRREFAVQIAAVRDLGVRITHLDSHQHLHLWPSVRSVVLDLARGHRIPAIRVPRSHRAGRPVAAGVNRLAADLARHAEAAGLAAPADAAGLDESGRLDAAGLVAALDGFLARGAPSAELGCHPGEAVDPDRGRYRWGFTWGAELALLVSPMTRRMIAERGFRLGSYDAL
jgi:predicted glycoside hydrolase/deacetylase ChbG (UPF0249 family)